jgi:hypothetical protein
MGVGTAQAGTKSNNDLRRSMSPGQRAGVWKIDLMLPLAYGGKD